ncbi:mycothione reductase [Corynebacterium sanguinis]|uniref:Mycothione reductase n=1 Tax=Corynebacterium sanguinis TaxID=2594913 RepID=A0A6C1TZE3_9CORY|nr:mycothione reductase [Corynebacterium sanguinis]MBA4505477.1 mycothione reductase [Corynebacterium sanguinis]MCT1410960.1 mycothione reductase [Corynebacterium sanguinis]MCT1424756.1 mycothione reductase [Corynebacterium sanguinis]MCT1462613.1 mycothione reductase [Corynebacterium sanguinis]MCT1498342.1 mycothione reductase [Corynebacterium sanguinis]
MNHSADVDTHYDLIIIGAGSGNSIPTPDFDDWSIAIIEEGKFGGTCMNAGCIPTKMFVLAADTAFDAAHASRLGVDASFNGADWKAITERIFTNRIDLIAAGGEEFRRSEASANVDVYDRRASFSGPKTIVTGQGEEEKVISGDTIIIAAGARPFVPEWAEGVPFHTSDDVMRLERQPESLTIVGGGFIAMEFAHIFQSLGTHVRIVNRSPFLRTLDADITEAFNDIADETYEVHKGRTVVSATGDDSQVTLTLDDGSTVTSEKLLIAMGRVPNGDRLNLEAGGIEANGTQVAVDEYGRASVEGVWALGDISSPFQLKHVANAETRAVRHNILHPDAMVPMPHDHVPFAVFTHPQIATVGLTEREAIDDGFDVTVKVQNYGDVAYGWALEDTTGVVKLVADRASGKLLGAHYMGPQASTLIQQMITIIAYGIDLRTAAYGQYWIHPALPEVTENAILGLDLDFPEV